MRTFVFCATRGLFLRNTGARAGPTKVWALWTQDNRGPHGRNRSPSPCSQKFFKGCGWVGSFCGSAHPLSPNGRMCAQYSPLPPFPTNPLNQHRNTSCALLFFVQHGVCFCATRGARARPTKVWALWTQDNRGPHGRNRSQALRCVHQPPLPVDSTLFWFSRPFTGVPPAHHGACTSWCLQAGAPEASWPRSAFPASYHQGEHKSRTPVTRFVDVRSEPPSHDGVSNLGYPRALSWRECRTSWSGTPLPKGAVEVVESVAS